MTREAARQRFVDSGIDGESADVLLSQCWDMSEEHIAWHIEDQAAVRRERAEGEPTK